VFVRDQDLAHHAEPARLSKHRQTRSGRMLDVNDQRELAKSSSGAAARTAGESVTHVPVEYERIAGRQPAESRPGATARRTGR
jgi:hypothetical protein